LNSYFVFIFYIFLPAVPAHATRAEPGRRAQSPPLEGLPVEEKNSFTRARR
jgi:hypothetical protein